MKEIKEDIIREYIKERYGKIAGGSSESECCGSSEEATSSCCSPGNQDQFNLLSSKLGYTSEEMNVVPESSNLGLGCGNPQAIAALKEGETVLDLGSGAGFDVFLAARQVGNKGMVIGIDMTPAMISKARENARRGDYKNVEFRLGEIENLPVDGNTIDVIISNCVINLSPEKEKVFRESFRVLKSGGRLAISDVVALKDFPEIYKSNMDLFSGCITGASNIDDLRKMMNDAGFANIVIKPRDESSEFIKDWAPGTRISDYIISAAIEAVKP